MKREIFFHEKKDNDQTKIVNDCIFTFFLKMSSVDFVSPIKRMKIDDFIFPTS